MIRNGKPQQRVYDETQHRIGTVIQSNHDDPTYKVAFNDGLEMSIHASKLHKPRLYQSGSKALTPEGQRIAETLQCVLGEILACCLRDYEYSEVSALCYNVLNQQL